ncbi:MAG: hypothetical protein ABIN37_18750 [Burkholderiaceae bacterium]
MLHAATDRRLGSSARHGLNALQQHFGGAVHEPGHPRALQVARKRVVRAQTLGAHGLRVAAASAWSSNQMKGVTLLEG